MKNYIKSIISLFLLVVILLSACSKLSITPDIQQLTQTPQVFTTATLSTENVVTPQATQIDIDPSTVVETELVEPTYVDMQISPIDNMKMVFVPAGNFLMGSEQGVGDKDEEPQHEVEMRGFWIDQIEVTNGMYEQCVNEGVCSLPYSISSYTHETYFGNPDFSDFPVIYVTWFQATKYCQWAGRRLPTEAEWEMAARGTENLIYPWGNSEPDLTLANFDYQSTDVEQTGSYINGASPYGAFDMAGNVYEWVIDWYDFYSLYTDPDPQGPATGRWHILRGGSWLVGEYMIRSAERYWASAYFKDEDTGFRCAVSD